MHSTTTSRRVRTVPQGVDLVRLREGLCALYAALPERAETRDRHAPEFVRLVLEASTRKRTADDAEKSPTVKEFAGYFLDRSSAYSTTTGGVSALLFENWLMAEGGELFVSFIETVLQDDANYYAIFFGELRETDLKLLREKTEEFVEFEVQVAAGTINHERGLISDVTILNCKAKRGAVDPAKADPKPEGAKPIESLLPSDPDSYRRVVEQGGLTAEAVLLVFGSDPFQNLRIGSGNACVIEDAHGTPWVSRDGGRVWFPDLAALTERRSKRSPEPKAKPAKEPKAGPTAQRPIAPPCYYETCASGALRSRCGSWVVFDAPVVEGGVSTVIATPSNAWTMRASTGDLREALDQIAACYVDMPDEFDVMAEAFLTEFATTEGAPVANPNATTGLFESAQSSVVERDRRVFEESCARLRAAGRPLPEAFPPKKTGGAVPPQFSKGGKSPTDDEDPDASEDPTAQQPPAPPEPPTPSDRMDDPPFYRDDLQGYYDMQLTLNLTPSEAASRVRQRFHVKGMIVTPAGEVRAPGVIDRPKGSAQPPPPPPDLAAPPEPPPEIGGEPAAPPESPAGASKPQPPPKGTKAPAEAVQALPVRDVALLAEWFEAVSGSRGLPVGLFRSWARLSGLAEANIREEWETRAGTREDYRFDEFVAIAAGIRSEWIAESLPVDQRLNVQTVDDAFMYWLIYEDGDLDEFREWMERFCPHLSDAFETWQPIDAPLHEGRLNALATTHAKHTSTPERKREKRSPTNEQREQFAKWRRLINLPSPSLRRFLVSEEFRSALKAPSSKTKDLRLALQASRQTLVMRATPVDEWTGEMWNWAGRQLHFVSRLRGSPAALVEDGKLTRKYLTLKAWGHDPSLRGMVETTEITTLQALPDGSGRANRLIDALPGSPPYLIGGIEERKAPDFDVLKKNRSKLSSEERGEVLARKAVWHPSNRTEPISAVWKSKVGEETYYVTNTHRAYNVATTLDGAVQRFHDVIKATA